MAQSAKKQLRLALETGADITPLLAVKKAVYAGFSFSPRTLENLAVEGVNLNRTRWDGVRIQKARMETSLMEFALFTDCLISDCRFDNCSLYRARFVKTRFVRCTFGRTVWSRARLEGASFEECSFKDCDLEQLDAEKTVFAQTAVEETSADECRLEEVLLKDCRLTRVRMAFARLGRCRWEGSAVKNCQLRYGLHKDCVWTGTQIAESDFSYTMGLSPELAAALGKNGNRRRSLDLRRMKSGTMRIVLPAAALLLVYTGWNLMFNLRWQSTTMLVFLTDKYLNEKRYEKVFAPVRVLAERGQKLPPQTVEKLSDVGMDALVLLLSQGAAGAGLEWKDVLLVKAAASELDIKNGKFGRARARLLEVLPATADTGTRLRMLLDLSRCALGLEEPDEALRRAEEAFAAGGDQRTKAQARMLAGKALLKLGRTREAADSFETALALSTDEKFKAPLKTEIAKICRETGDLDRALKLAREVLAAPDAPPDSRAESGAVAAAVLSAQGKPKEAAPLLEQALELALDPRVKGWVQSDLSRLYLELKDFDKALELNLRIVRENPAGGDAAAEAKAVIAGIEAVRGRKKEAEAMYEEALGMTKAPELSGWIGLELIRLLTAEGKKDRALELCQSTARLEAVAPDLRAEALGLGATIRLERGDKAGAQEAYEKAFALARDAGLRGWAGVELARLYMENGLAQKALETAELIQKEKAEPDTLAEAAGIRGRALAHLDRKAEAVKTFEEALKKTKNPEISGWIRLELARVYVEMDDLPRGLPLCQFIVSQKNVSPDAAAEAKAMSAQLYKNRGQAEPAKKLLEEALSRVQDPQLRDWIESELRKIGGR